MQITMAYSNEISLALPPSIKGTAVGAPRIDMGKQQFRKQQRPQPKSQPFDPEDLRRRLYVVIAEREAQNEKRQRQRVDSLPAKWAQVEREKDVQHMYIERLAAANTATWMPDVTAPPRRSGGAMAKAKQQSSLQDKLRNRLSMVEPSEIPNTTTDKEECPKYRHIPEQAAAQFSRTATSSGMKGDKSAVHSLSRAALRLYVEGASSADRSAIDSSITPGKQRKILQRTRSQREKQHERNQFQESRRRSSKSGPSERGGMGMGILEEQEQQGGGAMSALADLHLHTYSSRGGEADAGGLRHSSEETLVDTATANEHRVDWTQSDEMLPHERKGSKFLRKTTSILTLKGKLGGHRRKNSGGGGGDKEGEEQSNNSDDGGRLRIVTIQEACDEQAEADADDGSTPMSPHSGTSSSRSARLGLWGRLKRN
ncbi:hypothetical protein GGR55DRAFT_211327 [Xylaria sp. FL0064]|nr:hypothetical protein GGR55DRAFT_211327 [Xylaria sp. FL0064]